LGDIPKEYRKGTGKKTLKKFIHDFKDEKANSARLWLRWPTT
jgi:hypothetical protein